MSKQIVLEKWTHALSKVKQRLIYDAETDRIIHQFKGDFVGIWTEDVFTSMPNEVPWANEYLSDFNSGKA